MIFGSSVKGKFSPADIDVAMITLTRERDLADSISLKLPAKTELKNYTYREIFYAPLGLSLLSEGYSVRQGRFMKEILGIKPVKMYIYGLKHLEKIKKIQFSTALTKNLKSLAGERVGAGAVLVPLAYSGAFEDFLKAWGLKYKTKEYLIF